VSGLVPESEAEEEVKDSFTEEALLEMLQSALDNKDNDTDFTTNSKIRDVSGGITITAPEDDDQSQT
jgi:hypothetical protein